MKLVQVNRYSDREKLGFDSWRLPLLKCTMRELPSQFIWSGSGVYRGTSDRFSSSCPMLSAPAPCYFVQLNKLTSRLYQLVYASGLVNLCQDPCYIDGS